MSIHEDAWREALDKSIFAKYIDRIVPEENRLKVVYKLHAENSTRWQDFVTYVYTNISPKDEATGIEKHMREVDARFTEHELALAKAADEKADQ